MSAAGHELYGSGREAPHDDLVLVLALELVWRAAGWAGDAPGWRAICSAAAPISKWLHHESGDHLEVAHIHCRHGVTELQGRDPDHEVLEWDGDAFPLRFSVDPSRPAGDLEGQRIDRTLTVEKAIASGPTMARIAARRSAADKPFRSPAITALESRISPMPACRAASGWR